MSPRRALVTGASRGIGRACAVELAGAGHALTLVARSAEALAETASLVREVGGHAATLTCDLSLREQSTALVARVRETVGAAPDILVHVAGIAPSSKTVEAEDEEWDVAMEVNATAAFVLARAVLPHLVHQRWGRIINIASTAGRVGHPYTAAYTASKHAVVGLTRALAVEVARHGITVNAVCPGFTDTNLLDDAVKNIVERAGVSEEEARRRLAGMSPQQRFVEPIEVAKLVAFLASDDAASINGQAMNVDGGAVTS